MIFFLVYTILCLSIGGFVVSVIMRRNVEAARDALETIQRATDSLVHDARNEGFRHGEDATRRQLLGSTKHGIDELRYYSRRVGEGK